MPIYFWLPLLVLSLVLASVLLLKIKNLYVRIFLLVPFVVIVSTTLKVFCFAIYYVPGESMEDLLSPGDRIFVSKLHYGPNVPSDLRNIPLLGLLSDNKAEKKAAYNRFDGFSSVRRNDIVVFRVPGIKDVLVKRCVGMPGQYLKITGDKIFINGLPQKSVNTVKYRYSLWSQDPGSIIRNLDSLHIPYQTQYETERQYIAVNLNFKSHALLKNQAAIDSITFSTDGTPANAFRISHPDWTNDNLGPVWIPRKGASIKLTNATYKLYSDIIKLFERYDIVYKGGLYYHRNKLINFYTFRHNYYFMLGDNRNYSADSRYFGFIPQQNIDGKVIRLSIFE